MLKEGTEFSSHGHFKCETLGCAGALVLIPDDNPALAIAKYGATALAGGVALTFYAGGFLVAALQEEV